MQRFFNRAGQGTLYNGYRYAKIYKLAPGASSADLFLEHPLLKGIDGITFLDGTLYVNNVVTNHIYRIPVDASGKAGEPADVSLDQSVQGPDGMRAANGKLFVPRNHGGKVSVITVNSDKASVTVIQGRTQNTDRCRACRRHSLDNRACHR